MKARHPFPFFAVCSSAPEIDEETIQGRAPERAALRLDYTGPARTISSKAALVGVLRRPSRAHVFHSGTGHASEIGPAHLRRWAKGRRGFINDARFRGSRQQCDHRERARTPVLRPEYRSEDARHMNLDLRDKATRPRAQRRRSSPGVSVPACPSIGTGPFMKSPAPNQTAASSKNNAGGRRSARTWTGRAASQDRRNRCRSAFHGETRT